MGGTTCAPPVSADIKFETVRGQAAKEAQLQILRVAIPHTVVIPGVPQDIVQGWHTYYELCSQNLHAGFIRIGRFFEILMSFPAKSRQFRPNQTGDLNAPRAATPKDSRRGAPDNPVRIGHHALVITYWRPGHRQTTEAGIGDDPSWSAIARCRPLRKL